MTSGQTCRPRSSVGEAVTKETARVSISSRISHQFERLSAYILVGNTIIPFTKFAERPFCVRKLWVRDDVVDRFAGVEPFSSSPRSTLGDCQQSNALSNENGRVRTSTVSACFASLLGDAATAQSCQAYAQASSAAAATLFWWCLLLILHLMGCQLLCYTVYWWDRCLPAEEDPAGIVVGNLAEVRRMPSRRQYLGAESGHQSTPTCCGYWGWPYCCWPYCCCPYWGWPWPW